jgi:hypothetical protein
MKTFWKSIPVGKASDYAHAAGQGRMPASAHKNMQQTKNTALLTDHTVRIELINCRGIAALARQQRDHTKVHSVSFAIGDIVSNIYSVSADSQKKEPN